MEKSLGEYIRELRDGRDLSLRELAKLIGKSPSMISEIEKGNRFPSHDMMVALAKTLRTTVEELKKYDSRPQRREVNELITQNPDYGWVFRTVVDKGKAGVAARDLQEWIAKMPTTSNKETPESDQTE